MEITFYLEKKNHNIPRNSEGKGKKKINSSFDIETFKLQRISDIVFFSPVNNFNRVLPTNSVAGIIFIKIISSLFFNFFFFYHHTMLFNPPRLEVKVRDHLSLSFHCNYSNIAYNCRVHSPKYKTDIIKMSFI